MKLKLNAIEFPLHTEFELPRLADNAIVRATKKIIEVLNNHPSLKRIQPIIDPADFPDIEFPRRGAELELDIFLASHEDVFLDWCNDETRLPRGMFLINSGSIDTESPCSEKLRVIINCDAAKFTQDMINERMYEMDPFSDQYDHEYLRDWLTTITHEVAHAIEFVTHGHGLTPAEIDAAFDADLFDYGTNEVVTGWNIRPDMLEINEPYEANQIMEYRVEDKGKALITWCYQHISHEILEDCLKECSPTNDQIAQAMQKQGLYLVEEHQGKAKWPSSSPR